MMTIHLSPADLRFEQAEPRLQDLRLAEALGFRQARDIRKLIDRNADELAGYGEVCATVAQIKIDDASNPKGAGRPGRDYWLNEPQALLVCMFARTAEAARVRREIVQVFMAWRRGRAQAVRDAARPAEAAAQAAPVFAAAVAGPAVPLLPGEEGPLAAFALRLSALRECRLIHGQRAAARLWGALGLPDVSGSVAALNDEGEAALACLLSADTPRLPGEPVAWPDMRALLAEALQDDPHARDAAAARGCALCVVEGVEGVAVANVDPWVERAYAGGRWRNGLWRRVLRALPGAKPVKLRFAGRQCRATFLPAETVEAAPASW